MDVPSRSCRYFRSYWEVVSRHCKEFVLEHGYRRHMEYINWWLRLFHWGMAYIHHHDRQSQVGTLLSQPLTL